MKDKFMSFIHSASCYEWAHIKLAMYEDTISHLHDDIIKLTKERDKLKASLKEAKHKISQLSRKDDVK